MTQNRMEKPNHGPIGYFLTFIRKMPTGLSKFQQNDDENDKE